MRKWAASLVVLIAVCQVLSGCSSAPKELTYPQTVVVQEINVADKTDGFSLSGSIMPVETAEVAFKQSGQITQILVNEGKLVTVGDKLAVLDVSDYLLQEQAALAQLQTAEMRIALEIPEKIEQAKAQLDFTQLNHERVKKLYDNGAASQSQLDELDVKLTVDRSTYQQVLDAADIARVELGQAQAAYNLAGSAVADTTLYSPLGGVVLKKVFSPGEVAAAGYPVVVIGHIDQVWVEIGVTDTLVNQLSIGQAVNVYAYGNGATHQGFIDEIGYVADAATRTFPVKVRVDNPDYTLKPGMIVKADIALSERSRLCISPASILHLSSGPAVYVLNEESATVSLRAVTIGELYEDKIEILAGLAIGEKVVVEGQFKLHDGDEVVWS